MNFKILVLRTLLLPLILIVLTLLLNYLINPFGFFDKSQYSFEILNVRKCKVAELTEMEEKPELFVFGSSNSMRFSPETLQQKTGMKSYNLGVFYGTAEDYYVLSKKIIDLKDCAPKLVIICLDAFSFSSALGGYDEVFKGAKNRLSYTSELSSYLDDYSELKLSWFKIKSALTVTHTEASVLRLSKMVKKGIKKIDLKAKYNSAFFEGGVRKGYNDFEGNSVTELAESGEYLIGDYLIKKDNKFKGERGGHKGLVSKMANYDFNGVSEDRLKLLERAINELEKVGCKVILNLMPVQPVFYQMLKNRTSHLSNIQDILNYCEDLKSRYSNIWLVKDNSSIENFGGLENHFFDAYHPTLLNSTKMIESFNLQNYN